MFKEPEILNSFSAVHPVTLRKLVFTPRTSSIEHPLTSISGAVNPTSFNATHPLKFIILVA